MEKNPYSLRSKYAAKQKARRDKIRASVDVWGRKISRSRKYRGARMEGNFDGTTLLELEDKANATKEE